MSNAVQKNVSEHPSSENENTVAVGNNHLPIISLLTLAVAVAAMISIRNNYPFGALDAPGPGFYPLFICLFLVVCGVLGLIEWGVSRRGLSKEVSYEVSLKSLNFPVFIFLIAILGPLVYFAGFLISTIPAAIITAILIRRKVTVMTFVSMIIMPIIVFIVFDILLGISLP